VENIQPNNKSSLLVLLSIVGWTIALVFVLTTLLFWQQNEILRASQSHNGNLQIENEALQNQLTVEKDKLSRCVNNEAVIIDEKNGTLYLSRFWFVLALI